MENCSATGNPDPVLGQEDELSVLLVFLSDRFFCRYDLMGSEELTLLIIITLHFSWNRI